jgi:hypothetical protein
VTVGQTQTEGDGAHRDETPGGEAFLARRRARAVASSVLITTGTVAFWMAMDEALVTPDAPPPQFREVIVSLTFSPPAAGWTVVTHSLPLGLIAGACAVAPALWIMATWRRSVWARFVGCATSTVAVGSLAIVVGADKYRADLEYGTGGFTLRSTGSIGTSEMQFAQTLMQTQEWSLAPGGWLWLVGAACLALAFVVLPAPQRPPIED